MKLVIQGVLDQLNKMLLEDLGLLQKLCLKVSLSMKNGSCFVYTLQLFKNTCVINECVLFSLFNNYRYAKCITLYFTLRQVDSFSKTIYFFL